MARGQKCQDVVGDHGRRHDQARRPKRRAHQPVEQVGSLALGIGCALRDDAIDDRAEYRERRSSPQCRGRRQPRRETEQAREIEAPQGFEIDRHVGVDAGAVLVQRAGEHGTGHDLVSQALEFGRQVERSRGAGAVEPTVPHHRRRLQHVVQQPSDMPGIEQRCCDLARSLPCLTFGCQQPIAQCRPQPLLLLHALAIIAGVADQDVLDLVWIVDQQDVAQPAYLEERRAIGFLGKGGDGIAPQRPDRGEQAQSRGVRSRRGRCRPVRCPRSGRERRMIDSFKRQRGHGDAPCYFGITPLLIALFLSASARGMAPAQAAVSWFPWLSRQASTRPPPGCTSLQSLV